MFRNVSTTISLRGGVETLELEKFCGRRLDRLSRKSMLSSTLNGGSVSVGVSHLLTSPAAAVQSSSESETNTLENSVDGDISTCFTTVTETDPWWMVDLGTEHTVSAIALATTQDQTGVKYSIQLLLLPVAY